MMATPLMDEVAHHFDYDGDAGMTDKELVGIEQYSSPSWKGSSRPAAVKTLIVAIGDVAKGCALARLSLQEKHVATLLTQPKEDSVLGGKLKALDTEVYVSEVQQVAVVCAPAGYADYVANEWVNAIFQATNPSSVVVLEERPLFTLLAEEPLTTEMELRFLKTSNQIAPAGTLLSPPNVVDKISAAVLSYCEVKGINCAAYFNFVRRGNCDADNFVAFDKLFDSPPLNVLDSKMPPQDTYNVLLKALKSNHTKLYL